MMTYHNILLKTFSFAKILSISLVLSVIPLCEYSCGLQNKKVSKDEVLENINPDSLSAADSLQLAFNYQRNHKDFRLTYIEMGSTGCIECKRMEAVMDSVRSSFKDQVKVVFYHVRNNRKMTKHFDIQWIPAQILLDSNAKECFRHTGYYSFNQLKSEIQHYAHL